MPLRPKQRNQTSFQLGHKRSPDSIEKQRATLRAQYAAGEREPPLRKPGRHYPPRHPRICEACAMSYQPGGGKQRWCATCCPDKGWTGRLQRYGMGKPQWDEIADRQGGTCALCEALPACVDHDHVTGVVRGLLCVGCNTKLAAMENAAWRQRAGEYLAL